MCDFLKIFFRQIFDIGNSAGSLIGEAIHLFRNFQRLSATKTFVARFSQRCLKMFSWATDLVNIASESLFDTIPFTKFELFIMFSFGFPIMILTYISALSTGYSFIFFVITYGLFLTLGVGIGYIGINNLIALLCAVPSFLLIIIGIFCRHSHFFCFKVFPILDDIRCSKKQKIDPEQNSKLEDEEADYDILNCDDINCQISVAVMPTVIIFTGVISWIMCTRVGFTLILIGIFSISTFFIMVAEGFDIHCNSFSTRADHLDKVIGKTVGFAINILSLLIIPSTEFFVDIMQDSYTNQWRCIVGFVAVSIMLPLILTFSMVRVNHSDIVSKYRKPDIFNLKSYYYIELIDIARQIAYAVLAQYDIVIGCLIIEILWIILIIVFRPYNAISDYSLSFGNSFITLISNSAAIYGKNHELTFSFTTTIVLVVFACIPAVVSGYLFFIFDFDPKIKPKRNDLIDKFDRELTDEEKLIKHGYDIKAHKKLTKIAVSLTPLAWFFFGLNIAIIDRKIGFRTE